MMAKRGLVLLGLLYSAMSFAGGLESLVQARVTPEATSSTLFVDIQHARFLDDPAGLTVLVDKMLTAAKAQPFVDVIVIKVVGQTEYILPGTLDPTPWQLFIKGLLDQAKYRYGEKTVQTLLKGVAFAATGALLTTISTGPLSAFALAGLVAYVGWKSAELVQAIRQKRFEDAGRLVFDTLNDVAWSLAGGGLASWLIRKQGTTGLGLLLSSLRDLAKRPPRIDPRGPLPKSTFSTEILPAKPLRPSSPSTSFKSASATGTAVLSLPKPPEPVVQSLNDLPFWPGAMAAPLVVGAVLPSQNTLLKSFTLWEQTYDWNPSFQPVVARIKQKLSSARTNITLKDRRDFAKLVSILNGRLPEALKDYALMHVDLPETHALPSPPDDLTLLSELLSGQRMSWHIQALYKWAELCDRNPEAHSQCARLRRLRDMLAGMAGRRMRDVIDGNNLQEIYHYGKDQSEYVLGHALEYFESLLEHPNKKLALMSILPHLRRFSAYKNSDVRLILGLYAVHLGDILYRKHHDRGSFEGDWKAALQKIMFIRHFLFDDIPEAIVSRIVFSPIVWGIDALVGQRSLQDIYARAVEESAQGAWSLDHRNALVALALFEDDPKNPVNHLRGPAERLLKSYEITYRRNEQGLPMVVEDPTLGATSQQEAWAMVEAKNKMNELIHVIPELLPAFENDELFATEGPRLLAADQKKSPYIMPEPGHPYMWLRADTLTAWEYYFAYVVSTILNADLQPHEQIRLAPMRLFKDRGWFLVDRRQDHLPLANLNSIPPKTLASVALLHALLDAPMTLDELGLRYNQGHYLIDSLSSQIHLHPLMFWILNGFPEFGLSARTLASASLLRALSSEDFVTRMKIVFAHYRHHFHHHAETFLRRREALLKFVEFPILPTMPPTYALPGVEYMKKSFADIPQNYRNDLSEMVTHLLHQPFYFGANVVNPAEIFSIAGLLAVRQLQTLARDADPREELYDAPFEKLIQSFGNYYLRNFRILATGEALDYRQINRLPVHILVARIPPEKTFISGKLLNHNLSLAQDLITATNILSYIYAEGRTSRAILFFETLRKDYLLTAEEYPDAAPAIHAVWNHFWRQHRHERYSKSLLHLLENEELPRFKNVLTQRVAQGAFGQGEAVITAINHHLDHALKLFKETARKHEASLKELTKPK